MNRRDLLYAATSLPFLQRTEAAQQPAKIIDTHVHFYDPNRPGGVPWPPKDDKLLHRTVLPAEFRRIAGPLGVTAAIEVEASPLEEDNGWVLDLAAREPIIIATVGHLEPDQPNFASKLERWQRNPKFRGIRCGNLWDRDPAVDFANEQFIAGLRLVAQAGLEMDTANPTPALLADVVRLTDKLPDLRIVIDHLPIDPPAAKPERDKLENALRELGRRPQVYVKVSNVVRNVSGRVPTDTAYYRPALDQLWDVFGGQRLIYGSNWPVSNRVAPYPVALKVVREYFASKGSDALNAYFWRNAEKAYGLS